MKKYFKKVCVVLGLAGMGLTTTSCDSDILNTLLPIVTEVIGNMLTNNGGTQYAYTGTLNVDSYKYDSAEGVYYEDDKASATASITAGAICSAADSVVTVTLGEFKVGNNTISNFSFNTNYNPGTGKVGIDKEAYYTGGTCTVNGTAAEMDMACLLGTVNEKTLSLSYIDFYVGGRKYQATFSGTATTTAQ